MSIKTIRKSFAALLFVVVISAQIPAQTVWPRMDKLTGRSKLPESPNADDVSSHNGRENSENNRNGHRPHDGTRDLKPQNLKTDVPDLRTVPFWSDTYDYHGLRYTYKMVGTDPKRGSATTVVPVEIIPIRWVFSNGLVVDASTDVIDGQTAVESAISSPIFQDYDFTSGGTHVGNTQFGDAFQRANFWNSVSTRAPNYHVRLAQPTIMPTQTIVVPDDKVTYFTTFTGYVLPEIDGEFLSQVDRDLHSSLGVAPETLPIILWGTVAVEGGAGGYHGAYQSGNAIQTYISISTIPLAVYEYYGDVSILSHEIIEWMDDPLGDNWSAGWQNPFYIVGSEPPPRARCDSWFEGHDLLETADPFETLGPYAEIPIELGGHTYNMVEGAFIDFFTRDKHSRSVNGQYSFFEIARSSGFDTPPSDPCLGSVRIDNQFFSVPGSIYYVCVRIERYKLRRRILSGRRPFRPRLHQGRRTLYHSRLSRSHRDDPDRHQ